jgi:hypothetical protein
MEIYDSGTTGGGSREPPETSMQELKKFDFAVFAKSASSEKL